MTNYLLIHGAWMDQGCWSPCATQLRDAGHTVATFDLAGHGADATPLTEISLARYVDQALAAAGEMDGKVVLVGHSMAGCVISQAAEQAPELWSRLVYVAGYLPVSGQSLNDLAQSDADSQMGPNLRPAPDWSTLDVAAEARAGLFYHDLDPADAERRLAGWKAEPVAPLGTPLELSDARYGSIPRAYIRTSLDRVVSPALQGRMLAATPTPDYELAAGHAVMLSQPRDLADLLARLS